jgi:predicted sulfurtransferase
MYQVLLFYKYYSVNDCQLLIMWQKEICLRLDLVGRILISEEGINGTLCGTQEQCKEYEKLILHYSPLADMNIKKSSSPFICFDNLKIKYKKEIVILREDRKEISFTQSAPTITPDELHLLLENKTDSEDIILFDTRNSYESRIGRFEGALCPSIDTSRDFKEYFKNNTELFKNKKVVMYCTGGVRCERLSALCKKYTDTKELYHLKNGICAYVEKYPDGYFRGRNYVFDDRVSIKINNDILTHCDLCNQSCDLYNNCLNALCNKQYICCDNCYIEKNMCCSENCISLTKNKQVPCRPPLKSRIDVKELNNGNPSLYK